MYGRHQTKPRLPIGAERSHVARPGVPRCGKPDQPKPRKQWVCRTVQRPATAVDIAQPGCNRADGSVVSVPLQQDVRTWHTGAVQFDAQVLIPEDTPTGTYELLLHLPDAYESLADRPEYAIRLANEEVWEEDTGYNRLHHDIVVK